MSGILFRQSFNQNNYDKGSINKEEYVKVKESLKKETLEHKDYLEKLEAETERKYLHNLVTISVYTSTKSDIKDERARVLKFLEEEKMQYENNI